MSTTTEEKRTTRQIIWGALVDLRAQQQIATRQVLAEVTGLKLVTIDDHLNRMVEDGQLLRPVAGVVEIIDKMPPPRAVSVTDTPEKVCIIEVGDEMFRLWPEELRILAVRLSGSAVQYSNIQYGRETGVAMAEMLAVVRKLERENKALAAEVRKLQDGSAKAQMELLGSAS